MKWNFTKSAVLASAVAGALRAIVDGVTIGKPENGIATFILMAVTLGLIFIPVDIISFLRNRGSAGQQASKVR
jgi:hypothetical protein